MEEMTTVGITTDDEKTREETPLISLNINCVTVFNLLSYMFNWAFKDLIADRVLKLTAFKFWWWSA